MKANNCYFLNKEETAKGLRNSVPGPAARACSIRWWAKAANWIAEQAGLKVPEKTKILIAPLPYAGRQPSSGKGKAHPRCWPISW